MLREKPGYFDLVISDVHVPKMSGFHLLQCILQEFATLPVFLMSGDNEREMVTRGIQNGAAFYLTKPLTYSDIEKLWQHVFTRKMETKNIKQTEGRGKNSLQQEKQKIRSFHQKQKISSIDGSSSKANDQEHSPDSLRCQNQKINNIGVSSSKANDLETLLKPHELTSSQYSFSSFQAESRDGSFQGFNAPSSLFPTNNNQRLIAPAHQPWLAHNTFIENVQPINPQNIAAISHCNTTICSDEFMSELNFNVSEYLVDDDSDII
ncbi:hypothetical protein MKW98_011769 [Papaver atlanticum]|uniref:Response regulatory domain-containing protein n=1 Tax=Papaver atlanticum TaxID=357466 RepID=A0AAD4SPH6_9MAGN|nr:hypothetical protein MKW98_011769 [Papaver atlanticum]